MSYLEHVVESGKKKLDVNNIIIIIIREYPDVFMKELPGLPCEKEIEVSIETLNVTTPVA
jgi:hypothetical protein